MGKKKRSNVSYAEKFKPRGIGQSWINCFVCADSDPAPVEQDDVFKLPLRADMAAFVEDKKSGERTVAMFALEGANATLDFRPSEPHWVQVKVGACEEHEDNLRNLYDLTAEELRITPGIIRAAMASEAAGQA